MTPGPDNLRRLLAEIRSSLDGSLISTKPLTDLLVNAADEIAALIEAVEQDLGRDMLGAEVGDALAAVERKLAQP